MNPVTRFSSRPLTPMSTLAIPHQTVKDPPDGQASDRGADEIQENLDTITANFDLVRPAARQMELVSASRHR